ncbi:MAG: cation:proton antiporter [Alicyclobacillaceae bacterium]|nr:cation:proton antiporter [Alicyclobacillaceae bacterium]
MLALLLSTTSLGVIVPVLEETGQIRTAYGQTLLLSGLVADLVTMLLVLLYLGAWHAHGMADWAGTLAVIPFALAVWLCMRWLRRHPWRSRWAGDVSSRTRGAVALLAAVCVIADWTGAEPILGAFLAGIVVAAVPFAWKDRLRDYCHGLGYGFLIPVFFLSVGLHLQVSAFRNADTWLWIPALTGTAFAVKVIPAWWLLRPFGRRAAAAAGTLLSSRLSLVVAAAGLAAQAGAIPDALAQAMVVVALITCLTAPVVFLALA